MTDRPKSRLLSSQASTRTPKKQSSPLLRRIRRNRFWLLLYLWLALTLPGLVLCHSCGFPSVTWIVPLFGLAPALTLFILCTAMPAPGINYAVSLTCSAVSFLFHGSQFLYHRLFGSFFTLHSLRTLGQVHRFGDLLRSACQNALPQLLIMALPLVLLITPGRRLFSFRPLKRWEQHIPMGCACVLSHLLVFLCLPLVQRPADPEVLIIPEPPVSESVASESTSPLFLGQDFSPNQLDLDFSRDGERESIGLIHRYFAGRTPSGKNEKTGLFRGCNLIQITAGVSGLPEITEDQTPTLHCMTQEGFLLRDYHVPRWNIASFDGNYAQLTGIIPTGGSGSLELAVDNYMPLTMVQQQLLEGYSAWALHCCQSGTCTESRYLEALGYECAVSALQQPRDALDRWIGTLANHAPFTAFCSFDSICDISELEGSLALLADRLDSTGDLKNTVIVLSLAFEDGTGLCTLWKPETKPETVGAPTSPLDLLPTLSNLFGVRFDTRLYMGRDVFSKASPLVVLPEGSWITELAMYDAPSGKVTALTDELLPAGYVAEVTDEAQRRMAVSARILQEDYWAILFP